MGAIMPRRTISLSHLSGLALVLAACNGGATAMTDSADGGSSGTTGATTSTSADPPPTTSTTAEPTTAEPTTAEPTTAGPTTGSTGTTSTEDTTTTTDGTSTGSGTDTGDDTTTGGMDPLFPVHVGEVGPISEDNPLQYPFACRAQDMGLGQPEVDNMDGEGLPIKGDGRRSSSATAATAASRPASTTSTSPSSRRPGRGLLPYDPLDPPLDVAMIELERRAAPLRRPLRARHDQPLRLRHRRHRAGGGRPRPARPLARGTRS
jgi:hypothetical protein